MFPSENSGLPGFGVLSLLAHSQADRSGTSCDTSSAIHGLGRLGGGGGVGGLREGREPRVLGGFSTWKRISRDKGVR